MSTLSTSSTGFSAPLALGALAIVSTNFRTREAPKKSPITQCIQSITRFHLRKMLSMS